MTNPAADCPILTVATETYTETVPGARIYVVNHIPERCPDQFVGLTQIYAGPAAASAPPGELTDLLRSGRSLQNRRWSELSAIYKIWQEGPKSDVVGFCHYRRYFNFSNPSYSNPTNGIDRATLIELGRDLIDNQQLDCINDSSCITTKEIEVGNNVFEQYAECHNVSDYLDMFKIVAINNPYLTKYMAQHFSRSTMYAWNMFILSWNNFDELCRLWFGVLGTFATLVDWPRRDHYQDRDVSFLAERLFDAWIRSKQDENITVNEIPVFFVG